MLNREDVRKVLVARDKIDQRYKDNGIEDVPFRAFIEEILKEVGLDKSKEEK